MNRLFSQSRQIMVWFDGPKVSYIIPMYQGLESCLGANLEVSLDLSKSQKYQSQLQRILKSPEAKLLQCLPQNVTPLDLDVQARKTTYKTVVEGREVTPHHTELR